MDHRTEGLRRVPTSRGKLTDRVPDWYDPTSDLTDIEQFARTEHGRELFFHIEHLGTTIHNGGLSEMPPVQEYTLLESYRYWKEKQEKKKEREAKRRT